MSPAEISKEITDKVGKSGSEKFFQSYAVQLARSGNQSRPVLLEKDWVPANAKLIMVGEHAEALRNVSKDPIPWLESLPEEGWAQSGVGNFLRQWVSRDSFAAAERIRELPEGGKMRETGFTMVREYLVDKGEIEAAKEWELE